MRREWQIGWWFFAALIVLLLPVTTAWGYYFDDRREMSLSGFAYSRVAMATSKDNIRSYKGLYRIGNIVQHRNFLTLEWRHDIGRVSRELPTVGPFFQFLNFDKFDYYLNLREEYDGVWDYGPPRMRRQLHGGGESTYWDKYFGRQTPKYPGELSGRFKNFEYITNINRLRRLVNKTQLFEWYFNITKGPLFIRIGRQNLSWGETDGFRLLDQINPLNNNFGGFLTSLDERRVPLNMLRAQWNFGTVGPIGDLTLEGFVSPGRTTGSRFVAQGFFWNLGHSSPSNLETYRVPCGGPLFSRRNPNHFGDFPGNGVPCSFRPQGPHDRLSDSRGGGRLIGTIHDFTFSLAHYYTWSDNVLSAGAVLAPTANHLAWDLGQATWEKLNPGKNALEKDSNGRLINNPWGPNDPTVGANGVVGGPGGITRTVGGSGAATPAAVERSVVVPLRTKRVQISGASLSFPVNALTGMFVGSDNPLYYIYTTFRAEAAYFRNVPWRAEYHDAQQYLQRFMTLPLYNSGVRSTRENPFFQPEFLPKAINPNAHFSSEGNCTDRLGVRGCRIGRMKSRDQWAFSIGLDHNQWIRFLNPNNSFTITAQIFKTHNQGFHDRFKTNQPAGLLNDMFISNVKSTRAPIGPNRTDPKLLNRPGGPGVRSQMCIPVSGPNPPCQYSYLERAPADSELFTFSISTQYHGGNVRPSFTFFYDWAGGYLFQPGFDWTFYDPFRLSIRYNYIGGRYAGAIGIAKDLNTAWFELQYLLY